MTGTVIVTVTVMVTLTVILEDTDKRSMMSRRRIQVIVTAKAIIYYNIQVITKLIPAINNLKEIKTEEEKDIDMMLMLMLMLMLMIMIIMMIR